MPRYFDEMNEMNRTVRGVIQGLLDIQTAFDPEDDVNAERAVHAAMEGLLAVPGAVVKLDVPEGVPGQNVTGLLSGANLLVFQLLTLLSDVTGSPREALVSDLRAWLDQMLPDS